MVIISLLWVAYGGMKAIRSQKGTPSLSLQQVMNGGLQIWKKGAVVREENKLSKNKNEIMELMGQQKPRIGFHFPSAYSNIT